VLNIIWLGIILVAVVVGVIEGRIDAVVKAVTDSSKLGFEIALGLTGIMTLWLGIMSIATESGLVTKLGNVLKPVLKRLFPDVPPEHPAMGAMVMNIAANMLGMANAATPFGLQAMKELQSLNHRTTVATNSMCVFLAINTSSVQLIPTTAIAFLAANGSTNPSSVIFTSLIATSVSTFVAIIAVKQLAKLPRFSPERVDSLIVGIPFYAAIKKVNVFDAFIVGAKKGFDTSVSIIPFLIAMMVAIGMLRASGFFELVNKLLTPAMKMIGMPPEVLPLALIRPFSGSASTGVMAELIHQHGGDSLISKTAATMMGSTETTFYVIAVYFGSVGIRRTRHAIPAGLLADLAGVLASVFICRYSF
jgi:spore maturation protein A